MPFCYCHSNVSGLLLASDYCRSHGNQIIVRSLDNETVLSSSQKLGGAAKHLIDGSKKSICRLSFELKSPHVIERHNKGQASSKLACSENGVYLEESFSSKQVVFKTFHPPVKISCLLLSRRNFI